jgi:uncharacterized protein YgiM (DUF1202 family)
MLLEPPSHFSLGTTMKRFFVIALVLLSAAFAFSQTQNAAVKHNTYLRQGPSVDDKKVRLL